MEFISEPYLVESYLRYIGLSDVVPFTVSVDVILEVLNEISSPNLNYLVH